MAPLTPNKDLIKQLRKKKVYIITNQGSIPTGLRTPQALLQRLKVAKEALEDGYPKL